MLFAVAAPGLEPVVLAELRALGVAARAQAGGVLVEDDAQLERVNLWLRTASRVLVRAGELKATAFPELVRKAAALPWERFVRRGAKVAFHVTCRKSRLYHSGGVRERLHAALEQRLGFAAPLAGPDDESAQLFVARFDHDVCTISADSSGTLLHQRGWRGPQAKAPLRETLAAALLLAAGYGGELPLCDPLCGSGTIAIEAALIAMRRAPGLERQFAFQSWPGFEAKKFEELRAHARLLQQPLRAPIEASDQDAGAVAAARENVARADVPVTIVQRQLSQLPPDAGTGLLVCNPPYGVRVAAGDIARQLAAALRRRPAWQLAAVVAEGAAFQRAGIRTEQLLRTQNGGIRVEMIKGRLQP